MANQKLWQSIGFLYSTELFSIKLQENSGSTGKMTVLLGVFQDPGKKLQNASSFPGFPGVVEEIGVGRTMVTVLH